MPGRSYTATTGYRYGFNGKENDNEVKQDANGDNVQGGQQDYGMRIYDPRVGRFLSVDPISDKFPELTPYQFASNTPIWATDLDGLEANFSSAKLNREGYTDYGNSFMTVLGNSGKIGYNIGASAWNQTVGTVEDATNLLFSTKGRREVLLRTGNNAINLVKANEKLKSGQISPAQVANKTKEYLSNPENLENLAGAFVNGWIAGKIFNVISQFKIASAIPSRFKGFNTKGLNVWEGADAAKYLKQSGGKAAYMIEGDGKGTLILGTNATRQEIVEELIHHGQNIKYGSEFMTKNRNLIEVEAQDMLLKIGKKEKWSEEAMSEIREAKKTWTEALKKEKD